MNTILIVDDVAANRQVLVALLQQNGNRLLEAADGSEALAVAHAEHPDLVITDVLMPVMDGYELVRQLRLDPAVRDIPVVFYTAHYGAREARALALSGGVSDVLMKPIKSEEVLEVVRRALSGSPIAVPAHAPPAATKYDRDHLRLLTNKLSEKVDDIKTTNARLRALINIGLELASERDPKKMLQSVCAEARELFGATYVTLGIVDLNDRTVQHVVTCGAASGDSFKSGDAIAGVLARVVNERQPVRGDNPDGDPAKLLLPALHPRVHAFLAAPVASPSQVYGWFCLVGNEGKAFSDEDEDLVTALSGQIGRIYENGYFHAVARKRGQELEAEIVERKQAEADLRTAEERMRFALQNANIGIWYVDYATGAQEWSETLEAHYGFEPGTFRGSLEALVECVHADDRKQVSDTIGRAMKSGTDFSVQNRAIWSDGTVRWLEGSGRVQLDSNGRPVRAVGISIDVTDRHILEEQYRHSQKMEAIGLLAGGVAHDFNNLLTTIMGYCDLLLADLDEGDTRQSDIEEIRKAGESAAQLTRQLLSFSRKEIIQPTLLDLNIVAAGVQAMLGRLIGEDLKLLFGVSPAPALVTADRSQVEQILLNLALNARDAMPDGGILTIETNNIELDGKYAKTHPYVKPGHYVALTVSDTGTGMTPQVQRRMFEPFFSTKEPGKGTGLGLASVYGIVTRYGGSVDVATEIGKGTVMTVYFPRADASEIAVPPAPTVSLPRKVTETILLVEDADGLRKLTNRMLLRQGYKVLVAGNLTDAVVAFEANPSIDLLLTDVVMPGGSGPDLSTQLVAQRPGLKVIYMSGYTDEAIVRHGVLNPGIEFLHKPFTAETLGRKIGEVLETPRATPKPG